MLPADPRYVVCGTVFDELAEVRWKEVDEGWVRYDPSAGQTLLLAPVTRFVLDQLVASDQPLATADLAAAVLREEPDADPADCHTLVAIAVDALLDARLIQTESPCLENP